jgi:hypothetical protein
MPNESQSPKKPAGGPPPVPPSHDARNKKPAAQSIAEPPVVAPPPVPSTAPRAKISLSQFYKDPPGTDPSTAQPIEVEIIEPEATAPIAAMAANPLLASVAATNPGFDEEADDEFKLLPVEAKSAENIYTQTILADIEVKVKQKVIEQEKERIRKNNARTASGEGLLQFSTMQMFGGVIVGVLGIFLTRFVMTSIIAQAISFVLLMGCVVCFAMLHKSNDERVWLVAQPLFLLYIASLLIGIAIN